MKLRIADLPMRLLRILCAALMGALALTGILSVFFRYVLGITTVWSEELIAVLFVACTFLGTAMVARDGEHIEIDFLYGALPPRGAAALRTLVSLVVVAVLAVVFKYSLPWIAVSGSLKTPGLEIPFKWLYALLPLSCVLTGLVELGRLPGLLRTVIRGEAAK